MGSFKFAEPRSLRAKVCQLKHLNNREACDARRLLSATFRNICPEPREGWNTKNKRISPGQGIRASHGVIQSNGQSGRRCGWQQHVEGGPAWRDVSSGWSLDACKMFLHPEKVGRVSFLALVPTALCCFFQEPDCQLSPHTMHLYLYPVPKLAFLGTDLGGTRMFPGLCMHSFNGTLDIWVG